MAGRAVISDSKLAKPKPAPKAQTPKLYVHVPTAFKPGDKVLIKKKPNSNTVDGWTAGWNADMDYCEGKIGIVMKHEPSSGFIVTMLTSQRTFGFPSCALVAVRKKKRVRVGPGPWDAAPCPHLRWHLMGFFRGNLSIVKKEGESSDTTVRCEKCSVSMTLQAQPEVVRTTPESSPPAAS